MTYSHHAGALKQQNKVHKGEKKRCPNNQQSLHQIRGSQKSKVTSKRQRRLAAKQRRNHQISNLKRLMQHRGSEENPILCVIIPLAADIPSNLVQVLLKTCDPQAKCIRNNVESISGSIHIKSGSLKKCFGIVTASFKSTFACLDLAYLADWIVFLVPTASSQLSPQSEELLTALYAQGFINASFAVMSSDGDITGVRDIIGSRFHIPDGRVHRLNTKADAFSLLRHISTSSGHQKQTGRSAPEMATQHSAARFRSGLLADAMHMQDCPDDANAFLHVSGYLRGAGMFLSDPIDVQPPTLHLSGWGDFPVYEANWTVASGSRFSWKLTERPQPPEQGNDISSLMDTMETSSDDDEGDSSDEDKSGDELPVADACEMDTECRSTGSQSDGDPEEGSMWGGQSVCSAASAFSTAQLMKFRSARMEELFPDEVETPPGVSARVRFSKYRGLPRFINSHWATEKDTLPDQYENIACFKDYNRNRRSILRYFGKRLSKLATNSVDKDYIPVGGLVHFTIGPVPRKTAAGILARHQPNEATTEAHQSCLPPLVLWSLLPHETRLSVCHFAMHRLTTAVCPGFDAGKVIDSRSDGSQMEAELGEEAGNQEELSGEDCLPPPEAEPIRLKEIMLFQVGIRRFVASPIYSTMSPGSQKKAKLEQFFNPSRTGTLATVYAPVMYAPTNVLQFRMRVDEDHDGRENTLPYVSELVATGNLHSVDPWLVILKRIFLSGHPYKINKRHVVSRFMFFSPADIEYFKQVPLQTKNGASGHIKEPVGTHGHMKCVFDRKLNSSDVVLMPLYKRVFPKWTCDPRTPEALQVEATFERPGDDSSRWVTSVDRLQLRKKCHSLSEAGDGASSA